jgi:hypothetical protein
MNILIYAVVYTIGITISTALLAGSLFLVEDVKSGSFKELGVWPTLARCAGICVTVNLLGLLPYSLVVVLIVWFVGIMFLFQKTFVQTLILFLVNALLGCGISGAVRFLLVRLLS